MPACAPGRFCDVRERPVPIMPGLTRLPELAPEAVFLPLALEYPFWSEKRPEALACFGEPQDGRLAVRVRDHRVGRRRVGVLGAHGPRQQEHERADPDGDEPAKRAA